MNRTGGTAPRRRAANGRARTSTVALGLATLAASACGAATTIDPGLGTDTVPITRPPTTTTTEPAAPTTTVDFSRTPDQDTTPLPDDATVEEFATVIDDMRGPTADLAEQLGRLADFVRLSSPAGAQILDFSISVVPAEEERNDVAISVALRAPQTRATLVDFFDAELRSRGWNKAKQTDETAGGVTTTTQVYRIPGTPGDDTELVVALTGGPVTLIDIDYTNLTAESDGSVERLASWQDALRTPRAAVLLESRVTTAADIGTLAVFYSLTAETAAEARADMVELVPSDEFTVDAADGSGANAPPLRLVDGDGNQFLLEFTDTREADLIELAVSTSFGLTPID